MQCGRTSTYFVRGLMSFVYMSSLVVGLVCLLPSSPSSVSPADMSNEVDRPIYSSFQV